MRYGSLPLRSLDLAARGGSVRATVGGEDLPARLVKTRTGVRVIFDDGVVIPPGKTLTVVFDAGPEG